MKNNRIPIFLAALALAIIPRVAAPGQILIVADDYNVTGQGTGFALDAGVNTGINPPATRLTGLAAPNLRYYQYSGAKTNTLHSIGTNRFYIARGADSTTITLGPGAGAFNFGPVLRSVSATPELPTIYEIRIKMAASPVGDQRFSFALSSDLGGSGVWDFGLQINRPDTGQDFYTVYRRIDMNSSGTSDVNSAIGATAPGTWSYEAPFLIRVTDAGVETETFHSRVQVSMDEGATWVYDTQTDPELPYGWRLDTAGRYLLWDCPGWGRGTYDDFSVTWISGPEAAVTQVWTGSGADDNWSTDANWESGMAPANGDKLIFRGAARAANINDIEKLAAPWLLLENGGFDLSGNPLTLGSSITNAAGDNTLSLSTSWESASAKSWTIAGGSQLTLAGGTGIDVAGNHTLRGGGTLRIVSSFQIGGLSTANPALEIADGRIVLDGINASLISRGGFRIGVATTGAGVAETILTNGAYLYLNQPGGGCRVGDSANGLLNRLIIDKSTLQMSGGDMGVPWAAGATSEVVQVGGLVSGCDLNFNHAGAGAGVYRVSSSGRLEPRQIARNTPGGYCSIYFDNAILGTYMVVNNPFMAGLDVAEIQSGGLILEATAADIVVDQALSGSGSLTKRGGYAAVLTGANTYTGSTVVEEGRLMLPTMQTNATAIQVAEGAQFGVVLTAEDSSMTASSLTLAGASSALHFDLGAFANPAAPLMQVSTLSANGTVTVNISGGSISMVPGTITLVKYSGMSGSPAFVTGALPSHLQAQVTHNPGSIDLVISQVQGFRWTGAVSSDWDMFTTNWITYLDGLSSVYSDGFMTEFVDGAATGIVNLGGDVRPAMMVISNTTLPYVLAWGRIVTDSIRKLGTGTVSRVEAAADQVREVELNEGSLVISQSLADVTMTSVLTDTSAGGGALVKQGTSMLTIGSTNGTYDGAILVQEGVLRVGAVGALGSTNGTVTILPGASLDVNDIQSPHKPVIVSGTGFNGQGAITELSGIASVQHNLTDVTLAGDTAFGCAAGGRWDIRVRSGSGVGPGLRGNGFNLTKVGPGTVSIACQRHDYGVPVPYWEMNLGDVVIAEGGLTFAESLSLGNPARTITIAAGATLGTYDLNVTNPIVRTILMTDATISSGGGAGDTNLFTGTIQLAGINHFRVNGDTRMIIQGPIVGAGSVRYSDAGGGMLLLNGDNTYAGDTVVTNGTLSGGGSIAGSLVMLGGTNSPGWGVGVFTVSGDAVLAGTTRMELAPGQAISSDSLRVGGSLVFGGELVVVLAPGAAQPKAGDKYPLFSKGGSGGSSGKFWSGVRISLGFAV
ncbi:MAG TPA: autotransporter-associated beta strand repeat-containing protein, partial [Candidatus Paceibacterota bacterium]|nr:autotransporter-associated beta strand repeat-containing protein [Verrucomicrobiota bacterium]HRZ47369.1 autotransporter-associated beta strand repeat-containing protein [Candidatus Paceibacterota bacterium]